MESQTRAIGRRRKKSAKGNMDGECGRDAMCVESVWECAYACVRRRDDDADDDGRWSMVDGMGGLD